MKLNIDIAELVEYSANCPEWIDPTNIMEMVMFFLINQFPAWGDIDDSFDLANMQIFDGFVEIEMKVI